MLSLGAAARQDDRRRSGQPIRLRAHAIRRTKQRIGERQSTAHPPRTLASADTERTRTRTRHGTRAGRAELSQQDYDVVREGRRQARGESGRVGGASVRGEEPTGD